MLLEWGAEPTWRPIPADQKGTMKKNSKMKNEKSNQKWKMKNGRNIFKHQKIKNSFRGKYKDSIMKK